MADQNQTSNPIAPLFAERAVLLNESHARALLARASQSACFDDDEAEATEHQPYSAGVAVIPVVGILTKYQTYADRYFGLCPTYVLCEALANAISDPAVTAIVLDIDSPGGFVSGTVEFADAVAAANKVKPITAVIRGLCCSGAYWIASQCGKIVSRRESEVGNIGVYSVLTDVTKLYETMGVTLTLVASGQFKGLGADGKVTTDLVDDTRRIVTGLYQQFVTAVATGRKIDPEQAASLADGKAYLGTQAKQLGLVDEVATSFETTLSNIIGAKTPSGASAMNTNETKAGDAPSNDDVKKTLQATIDSAHSHKAQVRQALDHCDDMADEPDDDTKSLAKRAASAMKAASDESNRAAKAWLAKADAGDDDDKPDDDSPDEDGGEDDDAKSATATSFIAAFGDAGAKMFIDGKKFSVAATEFISKLQADHKAETDQLKSENTELKKKLSAMPRGNEAASFSVEQPATIGEAKPKTNGLTTGLNKFASGIVIPSK